LVVVSPVDPEICDESREDPNERVEVENITDDGLVDDANPVEFVKECGRSRINAVGKISMIGHGRSYEVLCLTVKAFASNSPQQMECTEKVH
jgi:hypothetical protein